MNEVSKMSKSQQTQKFHRNKNEKPPWNKCKKRKTNNAESSSLKCKEENGLTKALTDLALAVREKVKLERDNAMLNIEIEELRTKYNELQDIFVQNKSTTSFAIDKLINQVERSKIMLKESMEKENQHLDELKHLEVKNEELVNRETFLRNKIENLEKQLLELQTTYGNVRHKLKLEKVKLTTYKEKLTFSLDIIYKLDKMWGELIKQKVIFNKHNQTDLSGKRRIREASPGPSLDFENILLSELFFKEHPVLDDLEDIFFKTNL